MSNASTILQYSFAPASVFIGTTIDLKLIIENPVTGSVVNWKGGGFSGDEIDVTFSVGSKEEDLINQEPTDVTASGGFSCSLSGDSFKINSLNNIALQPGHSFEIKFKNMVINGVKGSSLVKIKEYIGSSTQQTSNAIEKLPAELNVIAWLEPYVVGLFTQAKCYWQSMGGTKVVISGLPGGTGTKEFLVSGDPPYPGEYDVTIGSTTQAQRTFTLTVFKEGSGKSRKTTVTLTQNPPYITSFEGDATSPVKVDKVIELSWNVLFGVSWKLTSNAGMNKNSPLSPVQICPGKELANRYAGMYQNMPDTVEYVLSVDGFEGTVTRTISYTLQPVQLTFFKYMNRAADGTLSGMKFVLDPQGWIASKVTSQTSDLSVLTLYQPGGSSEDYYLGDGDTRHPQIQYFNAADQGKNSFEFRWVTANLDSATGLILVPGNIQITGDDVKSGTKVITVSKTTEYTLSGVGTNGGSILSKLLVTVAT